MSEELHALVGAYVMDALEPEEREAFEDFLTTSPSTQAEVDSLRETVALLGTAAAATPPEGLRRAVMDQVDQTRQVRPVVTSLEAARAARTPRSARGPRGTTMLTRLSVAAAVVALAVTSALGISLLRLGDRLEQVEGVNAEVATLLVAPDAERHEATLPDGGVITALISHEHHSAVTVAEGLPALSAQEMYALWGLVDGTAVPIGELVNGTPVTTQLIGLDGLGLTVEPRGELDQPTGAVRATLGA